MENAGAGDTSASSSILKCFESLSKIKFKIGKTLMWLIKTDVKIAKFIKVNKITYEKGITSEDTFK